MADGDVKFFRFPITVDFSAPGDSSLQTIADTLLPNAVWDIMTTQLVQDTGVTGTKQVLIIVARAVS